MTNRHGFTLLELALVLLILGIVAGTALPLFAGARDGAAVRAARAELAAAFAVARLTAIRSGGASIVVDTDSGDVWIETAGGFRTTSYPLRARYGVTVSSTRASPVALRYDALGIGRITNATIHVTRRSASASLVVSAYGRVRT